MSVDEMRCFVQSLKLYEGGLKYCGDETQAAILRTAGEVINSLLDKLETQKQETREENPPNPLKERKEKGALLAMRASAREFLPPLLTTVQAYAKSKNIPDEFAAYFYNCMETDFVPAWYDVVKRDYVRGWRRLLLGYWKHAAKDRLWADWKAEHEKAKALANPKVYTADDWLLCKERCARFDAKRCKCRIGVTCPPQLAAHPHSPEECPRYKALSND